jgi:NADH dehydrogenase
VNGRTADGGTGAPRILIVGGGFADLECARRLAHSRPGGYEVTLVNPEDYSLYLPLLPDVAGGLLDPRHIAVPIARALPGARLVRGMVAAIDLTGHTARIEVAGRPDDPVEIGWDRLVVTAGSVTKLADVPGLGRHARGLKTLAEALYLRDHLLGQLELSVTEPDEERCRACRTVVVAGASYAGAELVAQLRGLADAAARQYGFCRGRGAVCAPRPRRARHAGSRHAARGAGPGSPQAPGGRRPVADHDHQRDRRFGNAQR